MASQWFIWLTNGMIKTTHTKHMCMLMYGDPVWQDRSNYVLNYLVSQQIGTFLQILFKCTILDIFSYYSAIGLGLGVAGWDRAGLGLACWTSVLANTCGSADLSTYLFIQISDLVTFITACLSERHAKNHPVPQSAQNQHVVDTGNIFLQPVQITFLPNML